MDVLQIEKGGVIMANKGNITFTISEDGRGSNGAWFFSIKTKHPRGSRENGEKIYAEELFKEMLDITMVLNEEGYGVRFEID